MNFEQFFQAHSTLIFSAAAYVFVAAVNNLPDPDQKFSFYPWFSGTLRTIINSPILKKFEAAEKAAKTI